MRSKISDAIEKLVSAADSEGLKAAARGENLCYEHPAHPRAGEGPDAIEMLNIALRDPAMRAAIIPHLYATGRGAAHAGWLH